MKGPTGELTTPMRTILESPCRLRFISGVTSDVDAAAQLLVAQTAVLSLPIDGTGAIRPNDLVTITAASLDPSQVGTVLRVTGRHFQTMSTARRLSVELVS
ncbi:hypothetical protein J7E22_10590 [Curtobacterium sp. ISL-83]|nr:hypothetical protein [Curtobacterium sp. ISL-83]